MDADSVEKLLSPGSGVEAKFVSAAGRKEVGILRSVRCVGDEERLATIVKVSLRRRTVLVQWDGTWEQRDVRRKDIRLIETHHRNRWLMDRLD